MKPPWYESTGIVPWLLLVAVALALALLFKQTPLLDRLSQHRDAIDAGAKVITALAVIVGGLLSYVRFFKGRLFRPKLVIHATAGAMPLALQNLHWIDIQIENRGSVAVWNHTVALWATLHGAEPKTVQVTEFVRTPGAEAAQEHLIDVGESSSEHALFYASKSVEAVTFSIEVADSRGTKWDCYLTAENLRVGAPRT